MLSEREFIPGDFFGQFGFGVGEVGKLGLNGGHDQWAPFRSSIPEGAGVLGPFPAEGGSYRGCDRGPVTHLLSFAVGCRGLVDTMAPTS